MLVVDDGSTDDTGTIAARAGALVLRHERNAGKGAALATGIARALVEHAEAVLTLDADGQHPPDALPLMVAPLAPGAVDLVLGARARGGAMPLPRRLTNWLSATIASRIAGCGHSRAGWRLPSPLGLRAIPGMTTRRLFSWRRCAAAMGCAP
jgi:glycosyltransferase involved in cell wall biosynthesis